MNNINHWYAEWRASDGPKREDALRHLYKHVRDQASSVIYTVLHRDRPDLATDAASDTLLKITRFRGDSEFATWAYKIARNVALMEARRMNSRREVQFKTDADEVEDVDNSEAEWLLGEAARKLVLTDTESDLLEAVLSGLSPQDWAEMNDLSRQTGWRKWGVLKRKLRRVIGAKSSQTI